MQWFKSYRPQPGSPSLTRTEVDREWARVHLPLSSHASERRQINPPGLAIARDLHDFNSITDTIKLSVVAERPVVLPAAREP